MRTQLPCFTITFLLFANFARQGFGSDTSLQMRLAEFEEHRETMNERMSVSIEKFQIAEGPPVPNGNRLLMNHYLQRLVISSDRKASRMDGLYRNVGEAVSQGLQEAQLLEENKGFYFLRDKTDRDYPGRLFEFERRQGLTTSHSSRTRTAFKHPFAIATSQSVGNLLEGDKGSVFSSKPLEIVEETVLDGGKKYIKFFVSNNSAKAITFNEEDPWRIEQIDFFSTVEPRRARAKVGELKKYASTRTTWIRHDSVDFALPQCVVIHANDGKFDEDWEIRFSDWAFGDKVDVNLLKEDSFSIDRIRSSIDFGAMQKRFDKMKRQ